MNGDKSIIMLIGVIIGLLIALFVGLFLVDRALDHYKIQAVERGYAEYKQGKWGWR